MVRYLADARHLPPGRRRRSALDVGCRRDPAVARGHPARGSGCGLDAATLRHARAWRVAGAGGRGAVASRRPVRRLASGGVAPPPASGSPPVPTWLRPSFLPRPAADGEQSSSAWTVDRPPRRLAHGKALGGLALHYSGVRAGHPSQLSRWTGRPRQRCGRLELDQPSGPAWRLTATSIFSTRAGRCWPAARKRPAGRSCCPASTGWCVGCARSERHPARPVRRSGGPGRQRRVPTHHPARRADHRHLAAFGSAGHRLAVRGLPRRAGRDRRPDGGWRTVVALPYLRTRWACRPSLLRMNDRVRYRAFGR